MHILLLKFFLKIQVELDIANVKFHLKIYIELDF